MTIEDLVKATGAPSVDALKAEMTALGIDADNLAGSTSYQQSLKAGFTQASALATTQDATPAKTKGKRKPSALKTTTAEQVAAVNNAGSEAMATVAKLTDEKQLQEFTALARDLAARAEETSDAITALALGYPGLVNQMAAQKINAGLANAEPGFCWADQGAGLCDRLKAISEEYGA